jgi:hypothetical protein
MTSAAKPVAKLPERGYTLMNAARRGRLVEDLQIPAAVLA